MRLFQGGVNTSCLSCCKHDTPDFWPSTVVLFWICNNSPHNGVVLFPKVRGSTGTILAFANVSSGFYYLSSFCNKARLVLTVPGDWKAVFSTRSLMFSGLKSGIWFWHDLHCGRLYSLYFAPLNIQVHNHLTMWQFMLLTLQDNRGIRLV